MVWPNLSILHRFFTFLVNFYVLLFVWILSMAYFFDFLYILGRFRFIFIVRIKLDAALFNYFEYCFSVFILGICGGFGSDAGMSIFIFLDFGSGDGSLQVGLWLLIWLRWFEKLLGRALVWLGMFRCGWNRWGDVFIIFNGEYRQLSVVHFISIKLLIIN